MSAGSSSLTSSYSRYPFSLPMEMSCLTSSYFSSIDNGSSPLPASALLPLPDAMVTSPFPDSLLQFAVSTQSASFQARRSVHRDSERPVRANSPIAVPRPYVRESDGVFEVPARNPSGFEPALPVGWRSIRPIEPPLDLDARGTSEVRLPEDI